MKKCIKKLSTLILMVILLLTMAATASATGKKTDYSYAVNGGNIYFDPTTGTITGCDEDVYQADIPREIYGIPVVAIGEEAFYSLNSKLTNVSIPASVSSIGYGAFKYTKLTSITIPNSVTSMGDNVFFGCNELESITIPGSVEEIPALAGSVVSSYSKLPALRSVIIQEGVKEIGNSAFVNTSIEEIVLPNSITEISDYAFSNCKKLKKVTVGSGIKYIERKAFTNCESLENIYFTGPVPSATTECFYNCAQNLIVYYPSSISGWPSPTWNGYITKPYQLADSTKPVASNGQITAKLNAQTVLVDGIPLAFDAYSIKDYTYFKLRDLAYVLQDSECRFSVDFNASNNTVVLQQDMIYVANGSEMQTGKAAKSATAKASNQKVTLNGKAIQLNAYAIDGYNYFKLRDLGTVLGFEVDWDGSNIIINSAA